MEGEADSEVRREWEMRRELEVHDIELEMCVSSDLAPMNPVSLA